MSAEIAVAPDKSVKRLGWGLLTLALASPVLMASVGFVSAAKAGELTVQVGFAWLAAAVAIDLLTRKRDAVAKGNGRIVAAVLALVMALVSGFNVYRDTQKVDTAKKELIEQFMASTVEAKTASVLEPAPVALAAAPQQEQAVVPVAQKMATTSEADRVVGYLNMLKARAKKFAEDSGAIDLKFNAVDLSTVLLAQNLVSKSSIEASRRKLNSYKAINGERVAMINQHFVLSEQIIRGSGLSEREVNDGMAGLNSSKGIVTQNYADLTRAQLGSITATEDILNFAQRGLGRISVQTGQPMFQTQSELDEYQRLIQALTDAAATETAIAQKVAAQTQKSMQAMVDKLK